MSVRRLLRRLLGRSAQPHNALYPVRPKVTPDPEQTAALERRRRELAYTPSAGFLLDQEQQR